MRRYVFLLFITVTTSVTLHAQKGSSLEWGKPISYNDFESVPYPSDTAAANISVTILLGYTNTSSGTLRFKVVAVMDKDKSWMRPEFRRSHILKHEQGHFDIAQIYARRLEAELKNRNYTSGDINLLHETYDLYLEEMNGLQVRYDVETKGGWDAVAQSKWRRFIAEQLQR